MDHGSNNREESILTLINQHFKAVGGSNPKVAYIMPNDHGMGLIIPFADCAGHARQYQTVEQFAAKFSQEDVAFKGLLSENGIYL